MRGKRFVAIGAVLAGMLATQIGAQAAPDVPTNAFEARLLQAVAGLHGPAGSSRSAGNHTRQLGRLNIPGGLNGDVWAHGNYAYVGTSAGEPKEVGDTWGFARIQGIASPTSPAHLSDFATPHSLTNNTSGFDSVHNPQIRGNTLYLSWYSDGLRIVDISNPSRPREVGFYRPHPTLDPTGVFQAFGPGGAHPIPFVTP